MIIYYNKKYCLHLLLILNGWEKHDKNKPNIYFLLKVITHYIHFENKILKNDVKFGR